MPSADVCSFLCNRRQTSRRKAAVPGQSAGFRSSHCFLEAQLLCRPMGSPANPGCQCELAERARGGSWQPCLLRAGEGLPRGFPAGAKGLPVPLASPASAPASLGSGWPWLSGERLLGAGRRRRLCWVHRGWARPYLSSFQRGKESVSRKLGSVPSGPSHGAPPSLGGPGPGSRTAHSGG